MTRPSQWVAFGFAIAIGFLATRLLISHSPERERSGVNQSAPPRQLPLSDYPSPSAPTQVAVASAVSQVVNEHLVFVEPSRTFDDHGTPSPELLQFLGIDLSTFIQLRVSIRQLHDRTLQYRKESLRRQSDQPSNTVFSPSNPTFGAQLAQVFQQRLSDVIGHGRATFVLQTHWGQQWLATATDRVATDTITYTWHHNADAIHPPNTVVIARKGIADEPLVTVRHFRSPVELDDIQLRAALEAIESLPSPNG